MAEASQIQYQDNFQNSGMQCHISGEGLTREIRCRASSFDSKFPREGVSKTSSVSSSIDPQTVGLGVGLPAAVGVGAALMPTIGLVKRLLGF